MIHRIEFAPIPMYLQVTCAAFHEKAGLLVVGFGSGVFGLWEVPA